MNSNLFQLCVSQINRIKSNSQFNKQNIEQLIQGHPDKQLILLLQIQSIIQKSGDFSALDEIANQVRDIVQQRKIRKKDSQMLRLILLKISCLKISKFLQQSKTQQVQKHTKFVLKQDSKLTLKQLRLCIKWIFGVPSLYYLGTIPHDKQPKQINHMIALVRLANNRSEQISYLITDLDKQKFVQKYQGLLNCIKIIVEAERQLMKNQKNFYLEPKIQNKQVVKAKIEKQAKIKLQNDRKKTIQSLSKLPIKQYLIYSPIVNYYYESDKNVLLGLQKTELLKILQQKTDLTKPIQQHKDTHKIHTALKSHFSVIQQNSNQTSNTKLISQNNNSFTNHKDYIQKSLKANEQKFASVALQGRTFIKYNFNNSKFSLKRIVLSQKSVKWVNPDQDISNASEHKIKDLLGIVYGKVTNRHLQSQSSAERCFSFIFKDRTLDLGLGQDHNIQLLFSYLRSLSHNLNVYRMTNINRLQAQASDEQISIKKKTQIRKQIQNQHVKQQNFTRGRLLWNHLFLSLNKNKGSQKIKSIKISKLNGIKALSWKILQYNNN